MAVANGVLGAPITRQIPDSKTGKPVDFFTYPLVTYSKSNGLFNANTAKTYLVFAQGGPFNTIRRYITGAVLDENGRFTPLKENEAFEVDRLSGELTKINNGSNNYIFGADARKALTTTGPNSLTQLAINKSQEVLLKSDKSLTAEQVGQVYNFKNTIRNLNTERAQTDTEQPLSPNGEQPTNPPSGDPNSTTEEPGPNFFDLDPNSIPNAVNFTFNGELRYPRNIADNGQDYIKFEILKYLGRTLDRTKIEITERKTELKGAIILGIQPRITDTNAVDWVKNDMNAYEMYGQMVAANVMTTGDVKSLVDAAVKFGNDDGTKQVAVAALSKIAVGSQNSLFTRLTGAIINPNVELLFQGPTLRQFPFSFGLSPRGDDEAKQVRRIIQAFKKFSAVQVSTSQLFLKTPYVFRITYMTPGPDGKPKIHPSLNRIKICALQSMSVDYTPAGSYMTYTDPDHTMTSYSVQLNFSELEPVYDIDYVKDNIGENEIGY